MNAVAATCLRGLICGLVVYRTVQIEAGPSIEELDMLKQEILLSTEAYFGDNRPVRTKVHRQNCYLNFVWYDDFLSWLSRMDI